MKNRGIRLVCVLSALWLGGCFKSVSFDTIYVLKPFVQSETSGTIEPLDGVKAYAFAVDTLLWTVASYEDALAGIVTSKRDLTEKITTPVATASPYLEPDMIPASSRWIQMHLNYSSVMIVVVDTQHKLYAYCQQELSENLSPLYVSIPFQLWRTQYRFTSGAWRYVNEFYAPERSGIYEYILKPSLQIVKDGDTQPLYGVKSYAYAADTTAWRLASYEDALAGIITRKNDPTQQRTEPDFLASPDSSDEADGWLRINSDTVSILVVAVDPEHRIYAYRQQSLCWYAPTVGALTYRLWNQLYSYTEDTWRVVNEVYMPEKPETPEAPDESKTLIYRIK